MYPILFRIPLPSYNLAYALIPFIIAALAAMVAVAKMVGKEKDRVGAAVAAAIAVGAIIVRFTALKGNTDSWNIGNIPIYSYGVMLGLSLVVGWYLTLGLAERDGLPKETMANNYVITAIAAVAGSRVLYILTNLKEFNDAEGHLSIALMFAMRKGGLVAYGGFLGGLAGSFFFLRNHKIPLLPWADVAVPSLASGLMITRIGCYLFGCDFGQPLPAGAPEWLKARGSFPHWAAGTLDGNAQGSPAWVQHRNAGLITDSAPHSLPVHPTQIYESLVGLGLLLLLLWARKKQKFRGQIFFLFAFAYGVCRYLLEILRDDAERGSIPPELAEHILIPAGLALLSIGWVIGFSRLIENKTMRQLTQVLAFIPPLVLYLLLKPEAFTTEKTALYSTSQFIAFTTGFAASLAFAIFHKAALAHPQQAMDLGLPREPAPAGAELPDAEEAANDADDGEEEPVRKAPAKKTKSAKGKAKKAKPAPKPVTTEDEDDGEEERAPAKAEKAEEAEKAEKADEEEPKGASAKKPDKDSKSDEDDKGHEDDGEPVKAG